MSGKIISFEGIECTGKSTQIRHLQQFLSQKNIITQVVREPGNTYIGEQIRNLLQYDDQANNMCAETELLLYEASRAQLIREFVLPTLQKNEWVIFDRFFDSSTAYQGAARHIPDAIVQQLNHFAVQDCIPSLTILLDIDVDLAFQRLQNRKKDRIERESRSFFEAVREKYLAMAEQERFLVIDAALPIDQIAQTIRQHVENLFNL